MRLCVAMLALLFLAGCDKPIITIDLKGQPSIPAQPAPPRFQIVMHPEFPGKFTFLLDTQTGAVWHQVEYPDLETKPSVWVQMEIVSGFKSGTGVEPQSYLEWSKEWSKLQKMLEKK